ncbi:hypothetical protein SLE2022_135360 [Rubroshorea leprosula]
MTGSSWWMDICKVDRSVRNEEGWLSSGFSMSLGDGGSTRFWSDTWVGCRELSNVFPRLFLLAADKNCTVQDMGEWTNGNWTWKLKWRRQLRAWEEDLALQLMAVIEGQQPTYGKQDEWSWKMGKTGHYTVKTTYEILSNREEDVVVNHKKMWKSSIPSKVSVFSWQLLQDKLPTKDNLVKRGVLNVNQDNSCCWCATAPEKVDHFLLNCDFAYNIWMRVCRWWGLTTVLSNTYLSMFHQHWWNGGKTVYKAWMAVWFAVVWTLWLGTNDKVFQDLEASADKLFDLIQIRSLHWVKGKVGLDNVDLTDWKSNPLRSLKHGRPKF